MDGYKDEIKKDSSFRKSFKFYKNKQINRLGFDQLIDVDESESGTNLIRFEQKIGPNLIDPKHLHLTDHEGWKIYSFKNKPGLLLARNIFTDYGHYYWPSKCLQRYPAFPNVCNIEKDLRSVTDFDGNILKYQKLTKKLRWITMGYHHDWDTKVYSESCRSDVPSDLKNLSDFCASVLGFENYSAEAVIVNFYHLNSTLAGHVDHSERNMDPPLLSFSFGQSAIFLIGGITPDEDPLAVYLRSGDLVVMNSSVRLAYHAVPRIVQDFKLPLDNNDIDKLDKDIIEYINSNRINMNVRQVN